MVEFLNVKQVTKCFCSSALHAGSKRLDDDSCMSKCVGNDKLTTTKGPATYLVSQRKKAEDMKYCGLDKSNAIYTGEPTGCGYYSLSLSLSIYIYIYIYIIYIYYI